jgi:acetyl esterase/lipase
MKNLILFALLTLLNFSFGQDHRYTTNLFSTSTAINNVVYGTAPFINGPSYTVESNTAIQNLVMDIYKPTGDTFNLRPAIIFAHSGGFYTGSRSVNDMTALCDNFAKKGYVTATIDYRQGFNLFFGNTDMHATRAVYRGLQDGRTAVRYLRANAALYGIDPQKIYFVGSSAGSFIALHTIYLDTAAEIPTQAGVVNYTNSTAPYSHIAPSLGSLDIGNNLTFNGKPDAVISMWGAIQSTNLITATSTTPVFLIHGETDSIVLFNTGSPFGFNSFPAADGSNTINTRLDALGITGKETYFVPNQPHEFYGTSNGTWSNGSSGNAYWPIILNKSEQFLWKQHKPIADYSWTQNTLTATFTDSSSGSAAWWWDFGDGTFNNIQNPTHAYTTAGTYQVKLYVENDIKSWDEITKSVIVSNLSIFENNITAFSIIPNPTDGNIKINWNDNFNEVKYQIYDVFGKLLVDNQSINKEQVINLNEFSIGLYFIKLTTENSSQTIKIIKK